MWDFDDGNIISMAETATYNHLYNTCDIYDVILTVTDTNNCFDRDTIITNVNCNPIASFTFVSECEGDTVSFTNFSDVNTNVHSGHNIIDTLWDFGVVPAVFSNASNPQYPYQNTGLYYIS